MDWFEQAAKLNAEWLAVQQKMMDNYQGAAEASSQSAPSDDAQRATMDAFSQFNQFGQRMAQQYAQFMTPVKPKGVDDYISEASGAFQENYQAAIAKTQQLWSQFGFETPEPAEFSFDAVMGPQAWWNKLYDPAQFGGYKLGDMPTFAGLTNYDKKWVSAVDEWQTLQKEIANYAYVVMSAWLDTHTKFQAELEAVMKSEEGTKGWREVVDFWQKTADKTLMEMHRSEDFLKAQKALIEASTAYRMAEQTVADETHKAFHIPTRSEIDDLHRKVYELSKDLRQSKKDIRALQEMLAELNTPPKKAPVRKAPARKPAAKRTTTTNKDSK